ncbi:MAG: hypothetical protein E4H27_00650 [Anaerolineales bacterium]|nr:MAG: hypothetical protein E4H27_00650 [Anaerolineales bacterium]
MLIDGPLENDWQSSLCTTCPVPQIKRANSCDTMQLSLSIVKRGMKFWEKDRISVQATCKNSHTIVENPIIGCGHCHTPLTFVVGPEKEQK